MEGFYESLFNSLRERESSAVNSNNQNNRRNPFSGIREPQNRFSVVELPQRARPNPFSARIREEQKNNAIRIDSIERDFPIRIPDFNSDNSWTSDQEEVEPAPFPKRERAPQEVHIDYKSITSEEVKRILECHLCCGQMTDENHLMCGNCSKTWCANCFRESLKRDRRCPNCRKPVNEKSLIKNCLISDIIHTQKANKEVKPSKDVCKSHNESSNIKCIDCDEKLCIECVCSEDHRGHHLKPLKSLFDEALTQIIEAKDALTEYSQKTRRKRILFKGY